jgi:hypothetical protein
MITKHPWFGPKEFGWGWRPVSWQGWLATGVFVAVVGAAVAYFKPTLTALLIGLVSFAAFLGVIFLTGSKPGGPD